jgi:hypothetical protein
MSDYTDSKKDYTDYNGGEGFNYKTISRQLKQEAF